MADEKSLVGLWAFFANKENVITLKNVMEDKIGDNLLYAYRCDVIEDLSKVDNFGYQLSTEVGQRDSQKDLEEAVRVAKEADIIIVALGEHTLQSGEAGSRTDITLDKLQLTLLEKLHEINKPIVGVLFNGRPLVLENILEKVNGLIEAWFPGTEGAEALADILFGDVNPSGKLSMSFPRNVGQIPIHYNEFKTGRPLVGSGHVGRFVSKYLDVSNDPRYEFGYGLSYTEFEYGEIRLDKSILKSNEVIKASITVKNIGRVKGKEIVQMYIQDVVGSVVRPVKELKGFKKIELESNESAQVVFIIPGNDLKFITKDMKIEAEKGKFKVFIGSSSLKVEETSFEYIGE